MIKYELETMSVVKQCELLDVSKSSIYYTPTINEKKQAIKKEIESIFEQISIYRVAIHNSFFSDTYFKISLTHYIQN